MAHSEGRPTPHATNLGLCEQPYHAHAPSDLGKDTVRVGISRGKEREAAERNGGWLDGPYQSRSHIFNSPTALSNPCRSLVPFFVPSSFSSDFPSFPSDLSPFRSIYRSVLFFLFFISPLPLYLSLSLFFLLTLKSTKILHLDNVNIYIICLKKNIQITQACYDLSSDANNVSIIGNDSTE